MSISVIIPAYNAEATIEETLESVYKQSLPPTEVIIVDDASTDRTSQLAKGKLLTQDVNRGAAAALNRGISEAKSEFLAFIDADDLWTPSKLEVQMDQFVGDGVLGYVESFVCPKADPDAVNNLCFVRGRVPGWLIGCLLIRREAVEAIGPLDETLSTGFFIDWVDRARHIGLQFTMINHLCLKRRIRPGTLSTNQSHFSKDFLGIAYRSICRKREAAGA